MNARAMSITSTSSGRAGGRPTRDIQDKLRQSFKSRRERGKVPYPVKFSQGQLAHAYDSWNQMFLATLTQEPGKSSITLHPFESPPKRVLDLGCGSGYWIIEAATKHWKETSFVGLDIDDRQPDVVRTSKTVSDANNLVDRVRWVKANFLEDLPFLADSFDFVRICGLGLAVPEDEWQSLLQEVRRVLEPGGIVEIIEEDLIFPAANAPRTPWSGSTPSLYKQSVMAPSTSSITDNPYSLTSVLDSDSRDIPYLSSAMEAQRFVSETRTLGRSTISSIQAPSGYQSSVLDPQDHSKLKAAWSNMLHSRFLAPRLTAVLPFYINSEFEDMQTHPAVHIALPPNSSRAPLVSSTNSCDSNRSSGSDLDLRIELRNPSLSASRDTHNETDELSILSRRTTIMNQRAVLHLARAVNTIAGCKETLWEEYSRQRKSDNVPEPQSPPGVDPIRQEFEQVWVNWENDMKDRMGMGGTMNKWLSWSMTPETERPEWRVWRDRVNAADSDAVSVSSGHNADDANLCRSLRGFVAWNTMGFDDSDGL